MATIDRSVERGSTIFSPVLKILESGKLGLMASILRIKPFESTKEQRIQSVSSRDSLTTKNLLLLAAPEEVDALFAVAALGANCPECKT